MWCGQKQDRACARKEYQRTYAGIRQHKSAYDSMRQGRACARKEYKRKCELHTTELTKHLLIRLGLGAKTKVHKGSARKRTA